MREGRADEARRAMQRGPNVLRTHKRRMALALQGSGVRWFVGRPLPAGSTPRAVAPPRNHLPMQAPRRPLLSPACSCPRAVAAARKTATGRRHLRGCVWGRGWGGWVSHAGADWARARQRTAAGRRGRWRDAGRGAAWRGVARGAWRRHAVRRGAHPASGGPRGRPRGGSHRLARPRGRRPPRGAPSCSACRWPWRAPGAAPGPARARATTPPRHAAPHTRPGLAPAAGRARAGWAVVSAEGKGSPATRRERTPAQAVGPATARPRGVVAAAAAGRRARSL